MKKKKKQPAKMTFKQYEDSNGTMGLTSRAVFDLMQVTKEILTEIKELKEGVIKNCQSLLKELKAQKKQPKSTN